MKCRFSLAALAASTACGQTLDTHPVRLDGEGKLLSWVTPQDRAFGRVSKLSADFIKARMLGPNDPGGGTLRYGAYPYGPWPNPVNLTAGAGMNYCIYATGPGKAAFQQWKENNGLPATLAVDSDDDGDGIPLLAEYALGTEPAPVSSGSAMGATLEDGCLTLTYSRNKATVDVTVRAEVSGDLVHWSHLPAAVQ